MCHFQRFPLLNPFGRSFKANEYKELKVSEVNQEWKKKRREFDQEVVIKKDQAQPYQENQPRPSIMFPGPASNDVLQIVQDYKIWDGNANGSACVYS